MVIEFIGWNTGLEKAAAQNRAHLLMATPVNMMTPTIFAQNVVEILCKSGVNVEVKVWEQAETHTKKEKMVFLSAAKLSWNCYYGAVYDERQVFLVGSEFNFDSIGECFIYICNMFMVIHQEVLAKWPLLGLWHIFSCL
jgi:aminopeptidase